MLQRGFKARCENMSLQVRKELGLQSNDPLAAPILAKHLGVQLFNPTEIKGLLPQNLALLLGKEKESWSAVTISFDEIDVIIHNSSHSKARQASNIMHELSHIMINHEPSTIFLSQNGQIILRNYNQDQEDEAAWLAGCLLLPRESLVYIRRKRISDFEACKKYGVSRTLLKYRMNVTGVKRQISAGKYRR